MSFIGIIADNKDYEFIRREISKIRNKTKIDVININKKSIKNMQNIKFDTIVIGEDINNIENGSMYINNILKNTDYLIINTDLNINLNLPNNKLKIITYGLNQKATVTVSSISEDMVLACLQRNIEDINKNIVEMQEFKMKADNITNKKIYSLLVVLIIQHLYN